MGLVGEFIGYGIVGIVWVVVVKEGWEVGFWEFGGEGGVMRELEREERGRIEVVLLVVGLVRRNMKGVFWKIRIGFLEGVREKE